MSERSRAVGGFAIVAVLLVAVGFGRSWSVSLAVLNLCLISAVMSLGVNIQWGYAGLFNAGVMAFAALGGLAGVLSPGRRCGRRWRRAAAAFCGRP